MGKEFQVDIENLLELGTRHIPHLEDDVRDTRKILKNLDSTADALGSTVVHDAYDTVREKVVSMQGKIADTLSDVAHAVCVVAHHYEHVDELYS